MRLFIRTFVNIYSSKHNHKFIRLNHSKDMRKFFTLTLLLAASWQTSFCQKKPLTHSVYDSWQSIGTSTLSAFGKVTAWEVNPQDGDGHLYVRNNQTGQTTVIPRGYRPQITADEAHVVALIKPTYAETRNAKIKKKKAESMPKDSLVIIATADGQTTKFANVTSYKMGRDAQSAVLFALSTKTLPATATATAAKNKKAKKAKKGEKAPEAPKVNKDAANDMMIYYLGTGDTLRVHCAAAYEVTPDSRWMAYVAKDSKDSNVLRLMDLQQQATTDISAKAKYIAGLKFNRQGDRLLFMAANDTTTTGSKHCSLYEYRIGGGLRTVVSSDEAAQLIQGWGLTDKSNPRYNGRTNRIYFGIQPYVAPDAKDQYDFETAEPNIWRYDADLIPPMFKVGELKNGTSCVTCTVNDEGKAIQIGRSYYDIVRTSDGPNDRIGLSSDKTGRILEQQWNQVVVNRLSLVDLNTGHHTPLTEGKMVGESISPDGKYAVYFDLEKGQWMLIDTSTRKITDISAQLGVKMYNEDNDVPLYATPYSGVEWTADGQGVVLTDRFDLWYVPVNGGKPFSLTGGKGRQDSIQYRYINTRRFGDQPGIDRTRPVYLRVFNYRTKENGIAQTDFEGHVRHVLYGKYSYTNFALADSADSYLVRRGNFREPMDLYLGHGSDTQRLSAINPQQQDYLWGSAELFQWKAFDGTKLDGILYKPDNFDPAKKYPVMIYFYERNSETLYTYKTPAPSRSIINIAYFVSNGYVVFVPDIVYKDGHPGKSAYNCIVAGAKALTAYKWIDSKHMAIQGQSWGGYQVAYLIAHTDMFAAAGAGAPVCNMTSAYGGIRWGSGMSRQFQYEQTQSRIGKDLWSGYDLYIENSPLFDFPKVKTPVLIMHNNADGAVPYYQGIEMFMGLRRLGKPAWLLEYNREGHNLINRKNTKDLSMRLSDFFDYYLKGAPMPEWMKPQTPYIINGKAVKVY